MEIRDEERRRTTEPNIPALLALSAILFIWIALSPIWIPCLAWLFSLFEPVFLFLGKAFIVLACLFGVVIAGFALAVVALVLGGGIPNSR